MTIYNVPPSPMPHAQVPTLVHPKIQICVTDEFLATDAFLSTRSTLRSVLDVALATQRDSLSVGKLRSAPENHTLAPLPLRGLRCSGISDLRHSCILGQGCVPLDEIHLTARPGRCAGDPT